MKWNTHRNPAHGLSWFSRLAILALGSLVLWSIAATKKATDGTGDDSRSRQHVCARPVTAEPTTVYVKR